MKKIFITITLFLFLANCAGGNVAQIKFGKRCTVADQKGNYEASYVWFVSKESLGQFDTRINKKNCSKS